MPQYRFVLTDKDTGSERAEEFGIFNDQGALQFARRYDHNREVQVWQQGRFVGRVSPASHAEAGVLA